MKIDKTAIRPRALELITADGRRVGTRLAQSMIANGHLQSLLRDGLIEAEGATWGGYFDQALSSIFLTAPTE